MITLKLTRDTVEALIAAAREVCNTMETAAGHARREMAADTPLHPDPDNEDVYLTPERRRFEWTRLYHAHSADAQAVRAALIELEAAAAAQGVRL